MRIWSKAPLLQWRRLEAWPARVGDGDGYMRRREASINDVTRVDRQASCRAAAWSRSAKGEGPSLGFWPWFLLAQPAQFPERMLAGDPAALIDPRLRHVGVA